MHKYAAILLLVCAGARAEFFDGNKLLSVCQEAGGVHVGDCLGYISGAADAAYSVTWCPPQNVTRGQIRDLVVNFLTSTPAVRHLSGDVIVSETLKRVWPCAQRNPGSYQPGRSL
jgi:hypothetical protein